MRRIKEYVATNTITSNNRFSKKVYFLVALLSIATVGTSLRILHLTLPFEYHHSFGEVFFAIISKNCITRGHPADYTGEGISVPPLGLMPITILCLSYFLFGVSEFSTRLPSLFVSILSFVLFYKVSEHLFNKNKEKILMSTLIFYMAPLAIYFSTTALSETYMILFVLASELYILKTKFSNNKSIAISSLLISLALFANFGALLYLLPFILLMLYRLTKIEKLKDVIKKMFKVTIYVLFFLILMIAPFLLLGFYKNLEIHKTLLDPSYLLTTMLYYEILFRLAKGLTPIILFLWICTLISCFKPKYMLCNNSNTLDDDKFLFTFAWYFGFLITLILFSKHVHIHEYDLLALIVPISLSTSEFMAHIKNGFIMFHSHLIKSLIIILVLINLFIISPMVVINYYYFEKTAPFAHEIGHFIREEAHGSPIIVLNSSYAQYAYYSDLPIKIIKSTRELQNYLIDNPDTLIIRYHIIEDRTSFFFIFEYKGAAKHSEIDKFLENNCHVVKEFRRTESNILLTRTYILRIWKF